MWRGLIAYAYKEGELLEDMSYYVHPFESSRKQSAYSAFCWLRNNVFPSLISYFRTTTTDPAAADGSGTGRHPA